MDGLIWDVTWYAGALALAGALLWLGFLAGAWWAREEVAEEWQAVWQERRRLDRERRGLCD